MVAGIIVFDSVQSAQDGSCESLLLLLEQFKPILNKYAKKLNLDNDDAEQEMTVAFIELIKTM